MCSIRELQNIFSVACVIWAKELEVFKIDFIGSCFIRFQTLNEYGLRSKYGLYFNNDTRLIEIAILDVNNNVIGVFDRYSVKDFTENLAESINYD